MAKLKKGWWCIEDECKHFTNPCRCAHPSIRKELGVDRLKLLRLQMCPVFTSLEACLIHKKIDVSGD